MVEAVDERLRNWAASLFTGVKVGFAMPPEKTAEPQIVLYLLELSSAPPARTATLPPLQFSLRYLVTVWAQPPEEEHRLLGELLFRAMETQDFEVELDQAPPALWSAFNLPPKPAFVLRVPLRKEREQPRAKPVRVPLAVNRAAIGDLQGVILGPGDVPIADARVEYLPLSLYARTDYKGRFLLKGVPKGTKKVLHIKARGREMSATAERDQGEGEEPLEIRFNVLEG